MRLVAPATSAHPSPVSTSAPDFVPQCTSASRSVSVMSSMRTTNDWMPVAANQAGCASHPRAASAARTASGVCAASAVTLTAAPGPPAAARESRSRPGRLRRRIPEDPPRGTLRRRLLLLRPFALCPRGRRRRVWRQPLAGHHHLHLLTLQRFALEQCRGQAIERGAPLGQDPLGFTIGVRENTPRSEEHTSELQSRENLV